MELDVSRVCRELKDELRFLRFLDEDDVEVLRAYLKCWQVRAGETLWHEGEQGSYLVFVVRGRLEEKKRTEFEGHQVIAGVYGPGAIVGEFGLLDEQPRAFTVAALEDAGLLTLEEQAFARLSVEHPQIAIRLLKGILYAVTQRLKKSFDRLAAIF
ncbi:cyclic nucleotide-binding domain-containing protein [Geoalkalibacter halelectricus]|uniref:Cyclic nucleotide-binding domain-containing protein n=1 Tax=Geoalkalibacter halelectricus TaxID=2847045 RepID=A0ABY5ZP60_9BACT|nr:cyclic nucleotide-binding domain-containing protein [Geoalkalibacter halelectricus]MDO3379180.1 cyclic nucleotide-binding domain-containing protein [Geoalkalibacter halelectricus]UWZ80940.1 cyclic nucleotide-binding domain-containing protein [Geoalkalibacter halelectricus]